MEITPELRAFLERCGLKKGATDQEAQAFMQRYQVNNGGNGGGSDPVLAERQRIAEIHAMGREFGLDQNFVSGLVTDGVSIDAARAAIMDRIMATSRANDGAVNFRSAGSSPVIMVDERDKFRDAAVDGFAQRAGVKIEQPAPGAELYRNTSLLDLSKECCRASSIRVHNLGPHQVVERALTTTDLPYIMSNVGNKALLAAYQAYPAAAMQLVRIGSVNDFKTAYRIRISEFPTLDEIPEHGNYRYGKLSEAQESFSLSTYGKLFAVTRQAIINDDLNALVTVPRAQAQAAKRLVDSAVISHLIANSAMADGNALFSSAHGNYVASGSGAAPSADTLKAAFLAMRTQTGLEGMVLNIQPRFLLTPAALETPSWQLLESTGDLSDNKNEGVRNPWYRRLELVVHPLLDSTSATGWYVLADPAMYDTIELAYLQGTDGPYLEQQRGWTVDGIEFKVRIDFGVKALDWRAMYFNHGA